MSEKTIDKSIPIPLYYQLKSIFLERIKEGIYQPGDFIPTEQDLIEKYNLSRTTVRQAIMELVNEGYLYRYKGKGTIVAKKNHKNNQTLDIQSGILETGAIVKTDLLNLELTKASVSDAEYLELEQGVDDVYVLKRLRYGNDEPVSYSTSVVPASLFPNLEKDVNVVKDHLYGYIGKCGYPITSREIYVSVGIADKTTAKLLNIKNGSPIMFMRQIGYCGEKPVEWALSSMKQTENLSLHFRAKEPES